jgi:3-methyl-2-oxobutanoate hydroxymethyltransferase
MNRKKLTVHDYLQTKGKRQLSIVFVHNVDEARAAEEAGIDMICTGHDAPQFGIFTTFDDLKRIREAAPSCFMQTGSAFPCSSVSEALKLCNGYMEIGADCVYGGTWSHSWIRELREASIPINSHVGLIPAKATWIGGFRAIGKTAEEAVSVLRHTLELQEAGAIGMEMEVVPTRVAEFITKHVDIITMSMGSGSGCDGQYLFANDILGYTNGKIPRHARVYRDFKKEYARLQAERVKAFTEFHEDVVKKTFDDPKITVGIEDTEFEKFLDLADKEV